jgi:hypothetical protein
LTRNKADEERDRKREYIRKRREDEQFRLIEAERKRKYRREAQLSSQLKDDEISLLREKVARLERELDQIKHYVIELIEMEDCEEPLAPENPENDVVEVENTEMDMLAAKVRPMLEQKERMHRLCGLDESAFKILVNDFKKPFEQLNWRAEHRVKTSNVPDLPADVALWVTLYWMRQYPHWSNNGTFIRCS